MNAGAIGTAIVSILMAIIGVAIIALLVSPSAQTGSVLQAGGSAFSGVLSTALSPVTGASSIGGILNSTAGGLGSY
jgi:hypothetical protein